MPSTRKKQPADEAQSAGETAPEAPRRRGRRSLEDGPALDQERLVATLLELTASEGLQAVNMRRVAQELKVSPRLLYHHVQDKDAMIDLLSDAILARHMPDLDSADWETRLRRIAGKVRKAWARYPGMAAAMLARSTRQIEQPHALRIRQAVMAAFSEAGLGAAEVELAYIQFAVMVLGGLVLAEGSAEDAPAVRRKAIDKSFDLGLDLLIFGARRLASHHRLQLE